MKKTYHRWSELRRRKLTPAQLDRIDRDAATLLRALPDLTLKEETLDQIEAQVKERRRHPARIPRL